MTSWLTDWNEARKKPARTLASTTTFGVIALGLLDYFFASDRNIASAVTAAVVGGIVTGGGTSWMLWPHVFNRRLPLPLPTLVGRSFWFWQFPVGCSLVAFALVGWGISAQSTGVALAGVPFFGIAGLVVIARKVRRS
jgi:hypothetical protein